MVLWLRAVRLRWSDGLLRLGRRQVAAGRGRVDRVRLRSARLPRHLHRRVGVRAVDRGHHRRQHVTVTGDHCQVTTDRCCRAVVCTIKASRFYWTGR